MTRKFQIDTTLSFAANFTRIADGQLVDPTEVIFYLQPPNGAPLQFTYPGTVTKLAVGQYSYAYTPSASGTWTYNWQGIGAVEVTLGDKQFSVEQSALIPG